MISVISKGLDNILRGSWQVKHSISKVSVLRILSNEEALSPLEGSKVVRTFSWVF